MSIQLTRYLSLCIQMLHFEFHANRITLRLVVFIFVVGLVSAPHPHSAPDPCRLRYRYSPSEKYNLTALQHEVRGHTCF